MKKALAIVMSLLLLTAAGCGGKTENTGNTPAASKAEASTSGEKIAASGEVFTITLTHSTAENTSMHQGALAFKDYMDQNSGGRIVVNIYPNAQMGGDREIIEGTQTGNITMMLSSNAPQVNFVPSAAIFDMPFVFTDLEAARTAVNEPDFFAALSKEYDANGFHLLGFSDQGFRTLTLNKPAHTPEDLAGVTLRTMENKYHMAAWKAIGANPTPLAFNELYTALQQKTVDGQENPLELIYSQKFYEQQKYVIETNHIYQCIVWIMNKNFYDSLPDDLKKVVDGGAKAATEAANKYQDDNIAEMVQEIKDYGVEFVELTTDELKAFSDKATSTWEMVNGDVAADVYTTFMKAAGKE